MKKINIAAKQLALIIHTRFNKSGDNNFVNLAKYLELYLHQTMNPNISNSVIKEMLENAKLGEKNWRKKSNLNPSLTKGAVWNTIAKDFSPDKVHNSDYITNLIVEFGEYLPSKYHKKKTTETLHHEDPIFYNE